ncbi:hypothetical protein [Ruegeria sp. PrR005]|uniref:Uncharacterized protein n=1 Tax=Ruegeria sp. PrR005 TaxID=2706882 RepID=A0A6B2NQF3_9RHOB|nr:hypothetical protein [Ruegeria sp. PrR005]NDW46352.1 hypothetical protein [Ruegeria sp. PrR005]
MSENHDILRLEGGDRTWFSDWLLKGMSCHEFGDCVPGSDPFPGAQHLIGMHEQLVDYLALIYDRLGSIQRQDFLGGVAEALRTLNLNQARDQVLASRLLSLATRLGAKEAIHVLGFEIDTRRSDPEAFRLVRELATAISEWPYPVDERTTKALYRLSQSPAFDGILARRALTALCKADPESLCKHLQILHPHLQERYAPKICRVNAKRFDERRKRVLEIHDIVPSAVFANAFEDWVSRVPYGYPLNSIAHSSDWWTSSTADRRVLYHLRRAEVSTPTPSTHHEPIGDNVGNRRTFPILYDDEDIADAVELLDETQGEPEAA